MTEDVHLRLDSPLTTNGVPKTASALHAPRDSGFPEICYELRSKVTAFLEEKTDQQGVRDVQEQARIALEVIEEALLRYGPAQLSISYNGGKDCLVLLILILAALPGSAWASSAPASATDASQANGGARSESQKLQALYIAPPDPFPEVEEFVATSTAQYNLDLTRYALPMRSALEAYLKDQPNVKAVFMGTRRTDPHSEFLKNFSPTDADWPQFMRVNPILDWRYADIWTFIRRLEIPFCSLYQRGFSSLGGVKNTRPNPALAIDPEGKTFLPAYELVRDDEERLGRDR